MLIIHVYSYKHLELFELGAEVRVLSVPFLQFFLVLVYWCVDLMMFCCIDKQKVKKEMLV